MSVKRIRSQSLGVNTLYDQLTAMLAIEPQGNVGLRQWYYATWGTWKPDHSITPLILKPRVVVGSEQEGETYTPQFTSVVWTETQEDGTERSFTSSSGITGYSVASDGTLTMTKNVSYDKPVSLRCEVTYRDKVSGLNYKIEETVTVTASVASEPMYSMFMTPPHQYFNPLAEADATKTIQCVLKYGNDDVTAKSKIFWYYLHNGNEVLVDDADDPCLAYVSGQGTGILTLKADCETDELEIICKAADNKTATAPNVEHIAEHATVRWYIPSVDGFTYSPNGDTVRTNEWYHLFKQKYIMSGGDVDEALAAAWIARRWSMKRADVNTVTQLGWGEMIDVNNSLLHNNVSQQVVVSADGYLLSPKKALKDGTKIVIANIGGVDKMVVGSIIETE